MIGWWGEKCDSFIAWSIDRLIAYWQSYFFIIIIFFSLLYSLSMHCCIRIISVHSTLWHHRFEPGLYELTLGFFCRRNPTVHVLVNGEPVLGNIAGTSPSSVRTSTAVPSQRRRGVYTTKVRSTWDEGDRHSLLIFCSFSIYLFICLSVCPSVQSHSLSSRSFLFLFIFSIDDSFDPMWIRTPSNRLVRVEWLFVVISTVQGTSPGGRWLSSWPSQPKQKFPCRTLAKGIDLCSPFAFFCHSFFPSPYLSHLPPLAPFLPSCIRSSFTYLFTSFFALPPRLSVTLPFFRASLWLSFVANSSHPTLPIWFFVLYLHSFLSASFLDDRYDGPHSVQGFLGLRKLWFFQRKNSCNARYLPFEVNNVKVSIFFLRNPLISILLSLPLLCFGKPSALS